MDYDGGEDARGSLLEHLDGRLEGESSSAGEGRYVLCTIVVEYNTAGTSMRRASSSLR